MPHLFALFDAKPRLLLKSNSSELEWQFYLGANWDETLCGKTIPSHGVKEGPIFSIQ